MNLGARYVATLRGHIAPVYRLAWSADSRLLVSASKDSTLKVRTILQPLDLISFTDFQTSFSYTIRMLLDLVYEDEQTAHGLAWTHG